MVLAAYERLKERCFHLPQLLIIRTFFIFGNEDMMSSDLGQISPLTAELHVAAVGRLK